MQIIQTKMPETMVAYYIVCANCKKELLSIDEFNTIRDVNKDITIDRNKEVKEEFWLQLFEAHIRKDHVGVDKCNTELLGNFLSVTAAFECISCREIYKDNLKVMESWAEEHEKSTGHSYFKFNYDHKENDNDNS